VTHRAREADQKEALRHLQEVDALRRVASVIRVQSDEA
jgi:hypothetical protein